MRPPQCLLRGRLKQHDLMLNATTIKLKFFLDAGFFSSMSPSILELHQLNDSSSVAIVLNQEEHYFPPLSLYSGDQTSTMRCQQGFGTSLVLSKRRSLLPEVVRKIIQICGLRQQLGRPLLC